MSCLRFLGWGVQAPSGAAARAAAAQTVHPDFGGQSHPGQSTGWWVAFDQGWWTVASFARAAGPRAVLAPAWARRQLLQALAWALRLSALSRLRPPKTMRFADNGIAADATKLFSDLGRGHPLAPHRP
jgi:hypothetical protein